MDPSKRPRTFLGIPLKEWALMNFGTILVGIGVYFFKFPNHFSTGGADGLSILLASLIPGVTPGTLVLVINLVLLAVGFLVLHRAFGLKTVYCALLLSLMTRGLEILVPMSGPMTDQRLLELFFAMLFPAIGGAILFNIGASTGGTDIIAMILKKFTSLDIGKALLCSDAVIASSALVIFDVETGLFCLLGLLIKSTLVDYVMENINLRKVFLIVTTKPEEICEFINEDLHRGATIWEATGAFTEERRWVILAAMRRMQAAQLRQQIKKVDPHAFIVLTNSSEIVGKGFHAF